MKTLIVDLFPYIEEKLLAVVIE